MKTRIYTVHLLEDADPVLVKQGFSWPAFFLAVPWALFHRMWWVAGAFVVLQIVLAALFVAADLSELQQGIVSLVVAIAIAAAADELRRDALGRRGYDFSDVVVEENRDRALRRFLEGRPELAARLAGAAI
jgi:hypothetical protein